MLDRTKLTSLIRNLVGREINDLLDGDEFGVVRVVSNNVFDIVVTEGGHADYYTVRVTNQRRH